DAVRAAVETLLLRQIELVAAVLPGMRSRGWGRILAIGSSGVQAPLPGLVLSNIGRAGLAGYLKTLASEVAADGVTVNMLLPGRFDTDRSTAIDGGRAEREGMSLEEVRDESQRSIPVGRYGDPAEFGAVAAFLCSGPASYLTGEQVRCDGGYVASY
ncbi:MAG TPA: SDR family oxidoreductase, partial [Pseudonocardia sp.]|nr:SDR family oxidoreductase [Pseudonocardia sp.]